MSIDLEHTNIFLRYVVEIILGLVALLLMALKLLGQRAQVGSIKSNFSSPPITQVEMLEYQMESAALIREEFDKLRVEMRAELSIIHRRIDELKANKS